MTTTDGRRLLDFASGQMSAILGHSHPGDHGRDPRAGGRARAPLQPAAVAPGDRPRRDAGQLAPGKLERVLLLSTGGESNEAALRMAKTVTGGYEVVGAVALVARRHAGAGAATYNSSRRGYGPAAPGSFVMPAPTPYRPRFMQGRGLRLGGRARLRLRTLDRQSSGARRR